MWDHFDAVISYTYDNVYWVANLRTVLFTETVDKLTRVNTFDQGRQK